MLLRLLLFSPLLLLTASGAFGCGCVCVCINVQWKAILHIIMPKWLKLCYNEKHFKCFSWSKFYIILAFPMFRTVLKTCMLFVCDLSSASLPPPPPLPALSLSLPLSCSLLIFLFRIILGNFCSLPALRCYMLSFIFSCTLCFQYKISYFDKRISYPRMQTFNNGLIIMWYV